MTGKVSIGEISSNEEVQPDYFLMKVILPGDFNHPLPGNFVMIRVAGLNEPFLGRPISIYSFGQGRKSSCYIELLYRAVGKGTRILAGLIKGSLVEIHGPLGGGFPILPEKKKVVFIAGGIGVAPLSMLAYHLCKTRIIASSSKVFYLGAKSADAIVGFDRLSKLCYEIIICTDDGTLGQKAMVTQAFQNDWKKYNPMETVVYACGPQGMLRSLVSMLKGKGYTGYVSMEERMACGTGACLGCAVATRDDGGEFFYKRVCNDGPVFNINEVVLE